MSLVSRMKYALTGLVFFISNANANKFTSYAESKMQNGDIFSWIADSSNIVLNMIVIALVVCGLFGSGSMVHAGIEKAKKGEEGMTTIFMHIFYAALVGGFFIGLAYVCGTYSTDLASIATTPKK